MLNFKRVKDSLGISLVVQWLRLHTLNAGHRFDSWSGN